MLQGQSVVTDNGLSCVWNVNRVLSELGDQETHLNLLIVKLMVKIPNA